MNIYPRVPNTSQPILSCTANMLEECGYDSGHVHPSGKYLFMQASSNTYEIEKVELGQKKIVDTGNSILLDWFSQFSPDGSLVYGATTSSSSGYTIQIYGFDADTGTAATGGTIWDQGFAPFFSAQRY